MLEDDLRQYKEEENPIADLCEKINDWYNHQQEQMLVDDIIACHIGGAWLDYDMYVQYRTKKVAKDFHGLTVNVQPLVMSKEMFEYAKKERVEKCEK